MIKRTILILLIFYSICCFSQTLKFKSVSFGFAPTNSVYVPKYFKNESIIFVNLEKKQVSIFDESESKYYIYKTEEPFFSKNNDKFTLFKCVSDTEEKLDIIIVELAEFDEIQNCSMQFVLRYDVSYEIYNINELD